MTTTHSIDNLKLTVDLGSKSRNEVPLPTVNELLFAKSEEVESPLNNALSLVSDADGDRWGRAREILRKHLDKPQTRLVLLENKDDGRGFQPERGEDIEANWVFSLEIPSLSDHIYWIVIPSRRTTGISKAAGYVYGFN